MSRVIGIDIDGVLADFTTAYVPLIQKVTGRELFPPHWRQKATFPQTWDFDLDAGYTKAELSEVWKVIKTSKTFWRDLKPLEGAVTTIKHLNWLSERNTDIYFLTNRMGTHAKSQTESWLYQCGMANPTVILVAEKAPLVKALGIEAFIDDKPDTLNDVANHAQAHGLTVKGHIYKMRAPYNVGLKRDDLIPVNSLAEMLEKEGL